MRGYSKILFPTMPLWRFLITRPTLVQSCPLAAAYHTTIFYSPCTDKFWSTNSWGWSIETHYYEGLLLDCRHGVLFRKKVKLVNKVFPSRGQHGLKNEQHAWKTSMIQDVVHFIKASAFKFKILNTNSCGWQLEFWWQDVISQKKTGKQCLFQLVYNPFSSSTLSNSLLKQFNYTTTLTGLRNMAPAQEKRNDWGVVSSAV